MELFVILILIVVAVFFYFDANNKKIVLANSKRIKTLLYLNHITEFNVIKSSYTLHQTCTSKRQFDRFSFDEYLIGLIDSDEQFYSNIIESISFNRTEYDNYLMKTKEIESSATEEYCQELGLTLPRFLWYEERLFEKNILDKPIQDVSIKCIISYTSPQGRNNYSQEYCYDYLELKDIFEQTIELKAQRQTRQYRIKIERAKLNDSLRYDIMRRDNFTCQLCGSTAKDGVKLHVDHIIPVSKGGETIESNLRTLCDRCNLGKRDKIE